MTETTTLRHLLLPELEAELKKTRRMLDALPEFAVDFKPHEKSRSLPKLAGHVAELPSFISIILTSPDLDMASASNPRKPITMETRAQLLAQFDENADQAVTALKETSDETFEQSWSLSRGEMKIFSGPRYEAYRAMGVNHMIHHRAQLGCYLRELNLPLPGTYGPSADGM
jgi:uncharacterized damage-inducible protein DinB